MRSNTAELNGLTADPSTLPDGCIWYRSDLNEYRQRNNGVTEILGGPHKLSWAFSGGRGDDTDLDKDLRVIDGANTDESPYICPVACKLKYVSAASKEDTNTWDCEIMKNDVVVTTLSGIIGAGKSSALLNLSFAADDEVRIRKVNANGTIDRPMASVFFIED